MKTELVMIGNATFRRGEKLRIAKRTYVVVGASGDKLRVRRSFATWLGDLLRGRDGYDRPRDFDGS